MTTQQAVQEESSMTDVEVAATEWVPRVGLMEVSAGRSALIRGLFALAAWVADHPELPPPSVTASVYAGSDGWDAKCRAVAAVATALGKTAAPSPGRAGTRYEVRTSFGPVELYSVAITDEEHAAYHAAHSYVGAVETAVATGSDVSGGAR
jgi:hypothetical protein